MGFRFFSFLICLELAMRVLIESRLQMISTDLDQPVMINDRRSHSFKTKPLFYPKLFPVNRLNQNLSDPSSQKIYLLLIETERSSQSEQNQKRTNFGIIV